MTDITLNYKFNTWKFQAQTWGEHVVYRNCFWHSEQFLYTTCFPHILQKEKLLTKIYLYWSKKILGVFIRKMLPFSKKPAFKFYWILFWKWPSPDIKNEKNEYQCNPRVVRKPRTFEAYTPARSLSISWLKSWVLKLPFLT